MQVQQQFVHVQHGDDGTVVVSTIAHDGDAMTARENEILVREWMAFAPDRLTRAIVHVPVIDPDEDRTRAHLVGVATTRGETVAIHLLRLDPEAFALFGDDPFRPWRHGVLLEDWDQDTTPPPCEPMAIGDGLATGLRAIFPEQYPVLEALLRRALAHESFALPTAQDDPGVEDLFEQLVHVLPRGLRRRQTMCTFVSGFDAQFSLCARAQDGATFRSGLRGLLGAPAPELDDELEVYVDTVFARLRAKDFDGASDVIDGFRRGVSGPVAPVPMDDPEIVGVASLVDDVVERVNAADDRTEAERTFDVVEDVTSSSARAIDVFGPAPVDASTEEPAEEPAEEPVPDAFGAATFSEASLSDSTPPPHRGRGLVVVLVVLALAAAGYGAVHFGLVSVPGLDTAGEATPAVDRLAVGPRSSLAAFVSAQRVAIEDERDEVASSSALRQALAAHRLRFEADARASWDAEKKAVDARVASVLADATADDAAVATVLRDAAGSARRDLPRLRALHVGITAGRPEALDAGADVLGKSTLAESVAAWADGLDGWAARFEALGTGDLASPWPATAPPTPGLEALVVFTERAKAYLDARETDVDDLDTPRSDAARAAAEVEAVWTALPFALRDLVVVPPELTVDDVAAPKAKTSR